MVITGETALYILSAIVIVLILFCSCNEKFMEGMRGGGRRPGGRVARRSFGPRTLASRGSRFPRRRPLGPGRRPWRRWSGAYPYYYNYYPYYYPYYAYASEYGFDYPYPTDWSIIGTAHKLNNPLEIFILSQRLTAPDEYQYQISRDGVVMDIMQTYALNTGDIIYPMADPSMEMSVRLD
jgi:hypothetical protein